MMEPEIAAVPEGRNGYVLMSVELFAQMVAQLGYEVESWGTADVMAARGSLVDVYKPIVVRHERIEVVNVRRYNPGTGNYEELAQCHECGHKVYREIDEDGSYRNERPVEYEEALALVEELSG